MRAGANADAEQDPRQVIGGIYSATYLKMLKDRFGFDALKPAYASELRNIGMFYIVARRMEDHIGDYEEARSAYLLLKEQTERFIVALKKGPDRGIACQIFISAMRSRITAPVPAFGTSAARADKEDDPIIHEFLQLLEIVRDAAEEQAKFLTPRSSRRKNWGLEVLVRLSVDFWTIELERRLCSLDLVSGTSDAFRFVQALLSPLDHVTNISSAMRQEIAHRRKINGSKSTDSNWPTPAVSSEAITARRSGDELKLL
jgi:hypothetical protein